MVPLQRSSHHNTAHGFVSPNEGLTGAEDVSVSDVANEYVARKHDREYGVHTDGSRRVETSERPKDTAEHG